MDLKHLSECPDSSFDCPRCGTRLKSAAEVRLAEGSAMAVFMSIPVDTLRLQLHACPECGKVEFFF